MATFPQKPRSGEKVLQGLYNSVCQIIDYLPSLEVRGDNKSTSVTQTSNGTIIHTLDSFGALSQDKRYYGIHGVRIKNNKYIFATLTGGTYIDVKYEDFTEQGDQYALPNPTINCTLSGGRYIEITPQGVINYTGDSGGGGSGRIYTGELNEYHSGWIWVDSTPLAGTDTYLISSTLRWIKQLKNDSPISDGQTSIREDRLSDVTIPGDHFLQTKDLIYQKGINCQVTSGQWLQNTSPDAIIDPETGETVYLKHWSGLQIDCVLTGGRYIQVNNHWSNGYGDEDDHTINCLLSGDRDMYPTDSYMKIVPYEISAGLSGGLISTLLHGDGTTVTIDNDGTIHSVAGGTIVASGVQYPNYQELHKDDYGYVSGIGISFMLPVESGANVCFYTGAGNDHAFATFASNELNEDDQYERATIYNGTPYQTSAAGWVRLSVFDDGQHQGECLEFTDSYSDSNSWNYSTPLYRFHGFKSLSADNTTIDITNNIISGKYYGDGTYIQVDGAQIKFIGTIGGGFKAPKYNLLNLGQNDAGIAASGLGTTYLVPVSKGSSIWYEGTATVAIWVPVEGSEVTQRHNVPNTSNSAWSTTDDGYVRLTVMDDGSNPGGCLKLHVGSNGVLPLHKYSAALSGAAGIMIENNGIRNMIQPGDGLTSTALMTTGTNPVMTGISFDLSAQYAADLASISGRLSATTNEDRILSSHNGTLSWQPNTASSPTWTSLTPTLLSVNNSTHQLSAATQTGGGTAAFAPDYSLLSCSPDAGESVNGLGVTFLLPVNAGDTYQVRSTGPTVISMFSPAVGTGTSTPVEPNATLTAETDGWVRVSVIDPGTSAGAWVRFLVNGAPYANGLPLYKSRIMQNLTGDGDTVRIENGQIKCISTPPPSTAANGTAVQSKTSFCYSPDIYYAEPNTTYYTSYKHDVSDENQDLAYPEEDLEWYFDSDNYDEGGDIIIALPEVDYPCMVKVVNFDCTYTTVITQDGKYLVADDGGNQGWASGQQSDKVGFNQTKIYVFQPTPIHWSDKYSGISATIEEKGGVWWTQTFS